MTGKNNSKNDYELTDVMDYSLPDPETFRRVMSPFKRYFDPVLFGVEELDLAKKPALFAGTHSRLGIIDTLLMAGMMYTEHGIMPRGLGDHAHFSLPHGKYLVKNFGMVRGTPENCLALMREGEHVAVYPGGARELMRRKDEEYKVIWKQRAGFARLAIQEGYDIIPFAAVGPDESYKVLMNGDKITNSGLVRRSLEKYIDIDKVTRGGDLVPPIVRGVGLSLIPRPQRYYFGFGSRISTAHVKGQHDDKDVVMAIRNEVMAGVEAQYEKLLDYRKTDKKKNWGLLRRVFA